MVQKVWWWLEKTKVFEEKSELSFPTTNLTWPTAGLNPGLWGGMVSTNCLRDGTTYNRILECSHTCCMSGFQVILNEIPMASHHKQWINCSFVSLCRCLSRQCWRFNKPGARWRKACCDSQWYSSWETVIWRRLGSTKWPHWGVTMVRLLWSRVYRRGGSKECVSGGLTYLGKRWKHSRVSIGWEARVRVWQGWRSWNSLRNWGWNGTIATISCEACTAMESGQTIDNMWCSMCANTNWTSIWSDGKHVSRSPECADCYPATIFWESDVLHLWQEEEQSRQCMYNVTLRQISAIIVTGEKLYKVWPKKDWNERAAPKPVNGTRCG